MASSSAHPHPHAHAHSHSQPIALPNTHPDLHIPSPSANSSLGTFNPASYTRAALLGSPMSWKVASSFGSRAGAPTGAAAHPHPGTSPSQFHPAFDSHSAKLSSSIDSDRGALLNAQDEHCRNYTCCGMNLSDLHALVDHFEESHVVVVDPAHPHHPSLLPAALPHVHAMYAQQLQLQHPHLHHHPHHPHPQPHPHPHAMLQHPQSAPHHFSGYPQAPGPSSAPYPSLAGPPSAPSFDPADDMELDMDASPASSSSSSPPHTPPYVPSIQTHSLPYVPAPYSTLSSQPSSTCPSPVSAFDTATVMPPRAHQSFNPYPPFTSFHDGSEHQHQQHPSEVAVAPSLVFGQHTHPAQAPAGVGARSRPSSSTSPRARKASSAAGGAVASSRQTSPYPSSAARASATSSPASSVPSTPISPDSPRGSTTLSRPASSLLLSKPFRCPKPNCSKSYKQANGLKYHMTHGACSFAPPKDVAAVQALLAEKGLDAAGTLSESDAREVEREAERRLRPFACAVGECTRRYKNMNGLRYHYQHSGEHGAEGLRLLASGQHECLQHHHHHAGRAAPRSGGGSAGAGAGAAAARVPPVSPVHAAQGPGGQAWYGTHYPWQQQAVAAPMPAHAHRPAA